MNVNKKFDRFKQWGKEKMGGEVQTSTSEDFKSLEAEMGVRQAGMERLQNSMNIYVRSLSKRTEGEGREKQTAIGYLGSTMTKHGEDFEDQSPFGACLMSFGQANERLARVQDTYATEASASWLDALERSLAQMKDYQNARKKLDTRRLAYDTSLTKMQKAKKEDYKAEDELRSQKAKFEESQEDVFRRMQDIIEAENDNVVDLYTFLEAEIDYHDRCRETLMQLKQNWPLPDPSSIQPRRGTTRSNTNNLSRVPTNTSLSEDLEAPTIPYRNGGSRASSGTNSPRYERPGVDVSPIRQPAIGRAATADVNGSRPVVSRTATEASLSRHQLRPVKRNQLGEQRDGEDDSPVQEDLDRSSSPATSYGNSAISRNTSWSTLSDSRQIAAAAAANSGAKKGAPPPPPPSRATKPKPPPPPPMKRSALSSGVLPVG